MWNGRLSRDLPKYANINHFEGTEPGSMNLKAERLANWMLTQQWSSKINQKLPSFWTLLSHENGRESVMKQNNTEISILKALRL